jgi:probable lipoprotein (TIGR04455 family)
MIRLSILLSIALLSSCSIVKSAHVRDDWPLEDQRTVRRLAIVVQPLPDGQPKAGELFARIARRYVNMKRDFLVKKEVFGAEAVDLALVCGGEDAIEGILHLKPTLTKRGSGYEASISGALSRCSDGRPAWVAEAGGSFPLIDGGLVEVTAVYSREFGAEVEPYVAPALNLLRPLLDTLPQPILTEDDVNEKLALE